MIMYVRNTKHTPRRQGQQPKEQKEILGLASQRGVAAPVAPPFICIAKFAHVQIEIYDAE